MPSPSVDKKEKSRLPTEGQVVKLRSRTWLVDTIDKSSVEAILYSSEARFSLDSNSGGSFHAYGFGGLFWWTDGDGTIYGPCPDLEDAVAMLIGMAEPNWCCSASGDVSDEFLVAQCDGLVEVGEPFEINDKPYVQTAAGLVRQ